jgi:hypothetical protein
MPSCRLSRDFSIYRTGRGDFSIKGGVVSLLAMRRNSLNTSCVRLGKYCVVLGRSRMSSARVVTNFSQTRRFIRLPLGVTYDVEGLARQNACLGGRIRLNHSIRARTERVLLRRWLELTVRYEGFKVQLGGESMRIGSGSVLTGRFGVG